MSLDSGGRRKQYSYSRGSYKNQTPQRYDKSNIQCYYCKKLGHFANECQKKQADMSKKNVNFFESNYEKLFITCNVAQESTNDFWFSDSGCSNHMTSNKDFFESLDRSIKSEVKLGNNEIVEVSGKGIINVMTKHGKKHISDVYFVPSLKHNLITVRQLSQKGYRVIFEKKLCTIFNMPSSNMVIAMVEMTNNRMFPLWMKSNMTDKVAASFKVASQDQTWTWHLRYGHINLN
jgi:hypothetical protein